jgi:AcrR family transcriptional regulator/DNA-binding MarR family transcriptional regulator
MTVLASTHRRAGSVRTVGSVRPGGVLVTEVQRARMLVAAARVLAEQGYEQMTVDRVTRGARVSRRTFYDLFEGREDCFLAVFDDALERASVRVLGAYRAVEDRDWREWVRAGLEELLRFFDEEPQMGLVLIVDALRGGPRVLQRRAEVLARVSKTIQEGGAGSHRGREPVSSLTGEGVVGGVLAVIHTRLSAKHPGALLGLLNPLVAMIVLPYQGPVVARRELQFPEPRPVQGRGRARSRSAGNAANGASLSVRDPLAGLPMRITYRTIRVLGAIAEYPGASNRAVGERAGTLDQGQISKLLARLEKLGLVENTTGSQRPHQPTGEPNAWRLTPRGEEVQKTTGMSTTHHIREKGRK